MRRYIYNDTLKKYYAGFGNNGMPTWSEKIRHAETFYSLADADEWKWLWATCGSMRVITER